MNPMLQALRDERETLWNQFDVAYEPEVIDQIIYRIRANNRAWALIMKEAQRAMSTIQSCTDCHGTGVLMTPGGVRQSTTCPTCEGYGVILVPGDPHNVTGGTPLG